MTKQTKKLAIIIIAAVIVAAGIIGGIVGITACNKNGGNSDVTITFDVGGGEEIAPVTLKKGEEFTLPKAKKDGLEFCDWYYDGDFKSVCAKTITAEKDLTLYARYYAVLSFNCFGGVELEPITYYEGETIGTLPVTYKDGFSFGGWYYDEDYLKVVNKKDVMNFAVTVYASFLESADTLKKLTSVKNVSVSPEIAVQTDGIILHNDNISDYISFVSSIGEELELICRPYENVSAKSSGENGGNLFIVELSRKLDEGMTYSVKALTKKIKVLSVDGNSTDSADEVTVTTFKQEKELITKTTTIHITAEKLARWEENVYVYMDAGLEKDVNRITLRTTKDIEKGAIVTIGEFEEEQETDYICKVIAAEKQNLQYEIDGQISVGEFLVLDVVTPDVDDIYEDLDIYGTGRAELEGVIKLSEQTVAENVEKNQGVVVLKRAVKNAVINSPTINNYMQTLPDDAEKTALLAALNSFDFEKPKVKINISGTVLEFEIELGGEIKIKNFKVAASVTIKNSTSVDYRYTICKSGLRTLNPLLWFYTDVKVDLSNDFSISLQASVEFTDSDDDIHGIIDITDEVEYIVDIGKDGQNKFAKAITDSPLWDDDSELEYVDIFSIPLGQIPLPVPIVSLQIDFNVVGSLGARAGLYVEFSHHYVETTTLSNGESASGENGKPVMFKEFRFNRATTENEIDISITLKGQVGFRCGLEVKLSLSIARLNNVAAAYVSFRFGPYIELSGLVSFRYNYDAVNKVSKTQLYGGMYLDVGLFVNAKLGAKFLVYDVNTDLFDKKISLYGVGDRLIPLEFVEKINSPDDPYVITSRYVGVRISTAEMLYLDIVTGEKVVDNALRNRYGAQLSYSFEFYDVPDYQTDNYTDYVSIGGNSVVVSRNFPYKSLKFAVKAKLIPRHGVYASGIERIFYVDYRNPTGRDYAVHNTEFRNEYYVGGGSTYSEVLERLSFLEGEQIVPPEFTKDTLPVRPGYYLDINDLWEKYFPFFGDKIDEDFDGTYPKVTYENASTIYNGYMIVNTSYYRLKWKQREFSADFYYPEYETADKVAQNKHMATVKMLYVPSLRAFIALTDKITAPEIAGKKYDCFVNSSGLTFTNEYYTVTPDVDAFKGMNIAEGVYPIINVDVSSSLYKNNFEMISGGAEFYATYSDSGVFTETYVLQTQTVKRIKVEYKPFDYAGSAIRPLPPESFLIGSTFTENNKTYVIKGYRDINPLDEANSRYYKVDDMPDVTKNRIYYLLYEREGYSELPVYYINVVANGKLIGEYGVKDGDDIKAELLKINFSYKTIISKLAGYPLSMIDDVIDLNNYSIVWNDNEIPAEMPDHDITVNVKATYSFKLITAEFVVSNPMQNFANGIAYETREDKSKVFKVSGKPWTSSSGGEDEFYSFPLLTDYFDLSGKMYYSFYGWKNASGEVYPYNVRTAFQKDEVYTPLFIEKAVKPTLAFISYGDYGYEYYYKILEGDYLGKTLKEVLSSENIVNPVRGDVDEIYEYSFTGWGVDVDSYVIGSEKDLNGNVKTYIVFKAEFAASLKKHTVTFDALGGSFKNGEKTLKVYGGYGEKISYVAPENYSDEKGDFTFVCWTKLPYSLEDRISEEDLIFGNADVTYYAYYSLSPATITLTFKGKVETESADGTGNVYFNGDKTQTELKVSGLYGSGYYLTANMFAVDSLSKTFVPDYLKWTVDGKEYISEFYNDGYMANVPFDNNAVIEIVFKPATAKIVNIAFVSDGECFELDGTKIDGVICKGYMSGLRHVVNYFEAYGSTILAPFVEYSSENYYRFDRWQAVIELEDGSSQVIEVKAGEQITFTKDMVFYGIYVHDATEKVELTFRSESYPFGNAGNSTSNIVGLKIFADGSVEIKNYGTFDTPIAFNERPSCKGMKFVGWTTDGKTTISPEELSQTTYSARTTYYAVYLPDAESYKITLNASGGKFAGGDQQKTIENVPYGKLAKELENPVPDAIGLVFSHFEDENGYPVTVIEKEQTLYARYAKPVSSLSDLQNINLALNENYVLTNDIDAAGGHIYGESYFVEWTAIGLNSQKGFSGTFNGNGYEIKISANSGSTDNFGLFAKLSGTLYNLSFSGYFTITGKTNVKALGALCGEVSESGRIIDCLSFTRLSVAVNATEKISVSGTVGVNNGLIDGLMVLTGGEISIDGNKEFIIGAAVGTNNGIMKNVNQSGMGGSLYVSLARSLECSIGSFAGFNTGVIQNSFSERAIMINFSQGDNVYLENSVSVGGFAGKNSGKIENASTLYGKLEHSISNVTLLESGLEIVYSSYSEYPCYIAYALGKDEQGITHTTKFVIYLDEDAPKKGSTEYDEYTLKEFALAHAKEAKKYNELLKAVAFESFVSVNQGETTNCTVIEDVGTGNGVELVSSCAFDGLKWNYLSILHENIYN